MEDPKDVNGRSIEVGQVVRATGTGLVAKVTGISHNTVTIETSWGFVDEIQKSTFGEHKFEVVEQ